MTSPHNLLADMADVMPPPPHVQETHLFPSAGPYPPVGATTDVSGFSAQGFLYPCSVLYCLLSSTDLGFLGEQMGLEECGHDLF